MAAALPPAHHSLCCRAGPLFPQPAGHFHPLCLYVVALDALFVGSFALTALLIFWRRPDDGFAFFVSIGLIMTGTRFSNTICYLGELGQVVEADIGCQPSFLESLCQNLIAFSLVLNYAIL